MKLNNQKYSLICQQCEHVILHFSEWFQGGQKCPECNHPVVDVHYSGDISGLAALINNSEKPRSLWHYFDFLPLHDESNIVSFGEGVVPIERWGFIERYAEDKLGITCKVYAHRSDLNPGTGTFKDLSGTVVASVLNENKETSYVVSSTGNTAAAYSKYLSVTNSQLYAFIPEYSSKMQEAEVGIYGQRLFRVKGDYEQAKKIGKDFAKTHNILLAAGNFDPMRIEAKKTLAYEWLRQLGEIPTVYCQALSGGTGPLGIAKACSELEDAGFRAKMPRQLLVQTNKCSPMADAWEKAKQENFPDGWENDYPVYRNPDTLISTLTTGDPKTYPILSKLVRRSRGEIIAFNEEKTIDVARLIAFETAVAIGPAAAIPVGGFLQSLEHGFIKDGDVILLNIGEGAKRSPDFMEKTIYTSKTISSIRETDLYKRDDIRSELWRSIVWDE